MDNQPEFEADEDPAIRPTIGKWSVAAVPHRGWYCTDVEDLGSPDETCQMCEVRRIRYVHHMAHDDYADVLRCGCVCAGHMSDDYAGVKERERVVRNESARKQRAADRLAQIPEADREDEAERLERLADWLPDWRVSQAGNQYFRENGISGTVTQNKNRRWTFVINDRDGAAHWSKYAFSNETAAAAGLVEAARQYLA